MGIRLNFIVEGQTEEAFVKQILSPYLAGFEVWFDRSTGIRRLVDMVAGFDSPELINDGNNTSPSKRIIGEVPEYERMKVSAAPIVAEKIGLPTLRLKCKHFGEWLCKLETLNKE